MSDSSLELRRRTPEQEARHYRKALTELIDEVSCVIVSIDHTMKGPSTHERGKRLGAATCALAWARDAAAHFGLRQEFAVIKRNTAKAVKRRGGRVEESARLRDLVAAWQEWRRDCLDKDHYEAGPHPVERALLAFDLSGGSQTGRDR